MTCPFHPNGTVLPCRHCNRETPFIREMAATMERQYGPPLVECYSLASVLTPEQLESVRQFTRETFTEMWTAIVRASHYSGSAPRCVKCAAVEAVRIAAGSRANAWADDAEGPALEASLYARAKASGAKPIMHVPRRSSSTKESR